MFEYIKSLTRTCVYFVLIALSSFIVSDKVNHWIDKALGKLVQCRPAVSLPDYTFLDEVVKLIIGLLWYAKKRETN